MSTGLKAALLTRVWDNVWDNDNACAPIGPFWIAAVIRKPAHLQRLLDGETGIRTRDTTIFSRVLYQLSYLAADLLRSPSDATGSPAAGPALCARLKFLHERLVGPPQAL